MTDSEKVERLQAKLKELANELAEWVEHNYKYTKDHPAMHARYERDMELVIEARTLLKQINLILGNAKDDISILEAAIAYLEDNK